MRAITFVPVILVLFALGCDKPEPDDPVPTPSTGTVDTTAPKTTAPPQVPTYGYEIVKSYPHDPMAFTQGLVVDDGFLYESTGLYDSSSVRKVALETGTVLKEAKVSKEYFAEGLALLNGKLYQLTWQSGVGFVYDKETFQPIDTFKYYGEGWGLTTDGYQLILSDGTNFLRFIDPETFEVRRVIGVFNGASQVDELNELEFIDGEIYANIWRSEKIVRIDPATGGVKGFIDLSGILPDSERTPKSDVMNGIAHDPKTGRIFVTGKRWPKLFEIRVKKVVGS